MVTEHDTIEEYVEVLSAFDSSDQLKLIAELTKRLADKSVGATSRSELDKSLPARRKESEWNSEEELAKIREAHRKEYGEVGDSWKELAGVWKDTMPDNITGILRADRTAPREVPNLDGK